MSTMEIDNDDVSTSSQSDPSLVIIPQSTNLQSVAILQDNYIVDAQQNIQSYSVNEEIAQVNVFTHTLNAYNKTAVATGRQSDIHIEELPTILQEIVQTPMNSDDVPNIKLEPLNVTPTISMSVPDTNILEQPPEADEIMQTFTHALAPVLQRENLLKCQNCDRLWIDEESRKKHQSSCTGSKKCPMCDYSCQRKERLLAHINSHEGVKPYHCTYCEFRTCSNNILAKHEDTHRKDNPFKCTFKGCNYIGRKTNLIEEHKKGRKFSCDVCDFSTVHEAYLKLHYRCKHNDKSGKSSCWAKRRERKKKREETVYEFVCAVCKWNSVDKVKTLLHLIHHPQQKIDEERLDISILKKYGIMK